MEVIKKARRDSVLSIAIPGTLKEKLYKRASELGMDVPSLHRVALALIVERGIDWGNGNQPPTAGTGGAAGG